ncbi:MAG: NAD(P)H-binding protein [Flavobacterium sp.]
MKALLIGATGATGTDLLDKLLNNTTFDEVAVFVRKPIAITNNKLKVHVVDFDQPEEWNHLVKGDVAFSCLGTTLKAAGSKEAQRKVDYDYQYNFAKAAKDNNVTHFILVSSYGANSKSSIFYSRIKGELEDAVQILQFQKTTIFNPGMLQRKNTDRSGEVVMEKVLGFINMLGLFRKYKPLSTDVLAQAMINATKNQTNSYDVIKLNDIHTLGFDRK